MNETQLKSAHEFLKSYFEFPALGLSMDLSKLGLTEEFYDHMAQPMSQAFKEMDALEAGAIANADEGRMVGHYWLRNPNLAPNAEIRAEITETLAKIREFARKIHEGTIRGQTGVFNNLLIIGIGGSALGPQFVADALGAPSQDRLRLWFFDNTDPDGMQKVLEAIGPKLGTTLVIVISKSGATKETRNGMLVAKAAYEAAKLEFERHAVAITQEGSELSKQASNNGWLETFPMWDWVGGRTSQMSAVGLLPAAIQGLDIDAILAGAADCDRQTRVNQIRHNPAALLAAAWYFAGNGKGERNMVVLPYKDRLQLFSKYLQQLIMESLGKELARDGSKAHQGITVFGNKGSTDQHSYVQQLRDGPNDFFVTFVEVRKDLDVSPVIVEGPFGSGDFLHAFYLGTRRALAESNRPSISICVESVSPASIGCLIALFERAVGLYASLVDVNAYHQPGVEAGKKAATMILSAKEGVLSIIEKADCGLTVAEITQRLDITASYDEVFSICEHLSSNPHWRITRTNDAPSERKFRRM